MKPTYYANIPKNMNAHLCKKFDIHYKSKVKLGLKKFLEKVYLI